MSEKELIALCQYWQKQLRVQDWDISISFANGYDLDGTMGKTTIRPRTKRATIKILQPDDYPDADNCLSEIEDTVVHELLHVAMSPAEPKDEVGEEQFIEILTKVLVRFHKAKC